jgi:hypothetical protein
VEAVCALPRDAITSKSKTTDEMFFILTFDAK